MVIQHKIKIIAASRMSHQVNMHTKVANKSEICLDIHKATAHKI